MSSFTQDYFKETQHILSEIDPLQVEALVESVATVRERKGRLFILGVGGSAAHASHAVNDFRKICGVEAYAPTDNVGELTARVNDEGWEHTFSRWLITSNLNTNDGVMIFSVGGGDLEKNVSPNIVRALELAKSVDCEIMGIVGKNGGYTKKVAKSCVVIPPIIPDRITPHTEGLCAVVWHLVVSHPGLKLNPTKWESTL